MSKVSIESNGDSFQITLDRLAQITSTADGFMIDLVNPSTQIVQRDSRLIFRLNPRLAFVAPEERGSVAEELGLPPYQFIPDGEYLL